MKLPKNNDQKKRILAIDYGEKRIGIAVSDPNQSVGFPREVFINKSEGKTLDHLRKLVKSEEVGLIIVGWPISLAGEETQQTRKTNQFIQSLEAAFSIPIEKMDERWSTVQAERWGGDDSVAAQILLQTYLDMIN